MNSQTRDDRESPKPRRARRANSIPITYGEPPTNSSTPKGKKEKEPAKEATPAKLYATKYQAIKAERRNKGQLEYLVNWADDPESGEPYAPTWEPWDFVVKAGRKQWKEQKREGLVVLKDGQLVLRDLDDIETQQPAKRTRESFDSLQERGEPHKKPRRSGGLRTNLGSKTTVKSEKEVREVNDTYEDGEDILPLPNSSNIEVLVRVPDGFDRDQYQVIAISSQSSEESISQDKTDDYSPQDSIPKSNIEQENSTLVPYPRSQFVILDSQDQIDSESYDPNQSIPSTKLDTQDIQAASGSVSDRAEDSQLDAESNPDSIDSETGELLYEIDCTYQNNTSSAPDEGTTPTPSTQSAKGPLVSPEHLALESTQSTNSKSNSQLSSQVLSAKSLSQLLTPDREIQRSQDGHIIISSPSQLIRSTGPSFQGSQPVSQGDSHIHLPSPDNNVPTECSDLDNFSLSSSRRLATNTSHRVISEEKQQSLGSLSRSRSQDFQYHHKSFVQFSAPSQTELKGHPIHSIQDNSLPIPATIQSTFELSDQVLQSIEGNDEKIENKDYDDEDELPLRQVSSGYEYWPSANMDDLEAKRAAQKAARIRESLDGLRALSNNAEAEFMARATSSSIPPPPFPTITQQVSTTCVAEEHTVEEFAVKEGAVKEGTVKEGMLFGNGQSDHHKEISPPSDGSLRVQADSDNQFFLPLPLNANTREVYLTELRNSRTRRNKFTDVKVLDYQLVTEIDEVISTLDLLCSHLDLIIGDLTQGMDTVGALAVYAETSSTKCIFVAELIESMRPLDKHIAILVRPGRMRDILDSILTHHKYSLKPQSQMTYQCAASGALTVSLIPTGQSGQGLACADLMIAFDSTFNDEPYLKAMRLDPYTKLLCPLVHLLVTYSIEHIDKVFSKDTEAIERKIKICMSLSNYIEDLGKLGGEYPSPHHAAELISEFVATGSNSWPLLPMPTIDDPSVDPETQADSESFRQTGSLRDSYDPTIPPAASHQKLKRPIDGNDDMMMDTGTPKRQKLTPFPDEQEERFSEEGRPGKVDVLNQSLLAQESDLLDEIAALKTMLRDKEDAETRVRQLNADLLRQVEDLNLSMSKIQPKFQAALNDRGKFEHNAKEAISKATTLKKNLDSRHDEVTKLKKDEQALVAELATTRAALASSSIPEVAELEDLRAQIRSLEFDNAVLEKNKISSEKRFDYMRENYQNASNSAAESAKAVTALQSELETLRAKADQNRVEIHKIQRESDIQNYLRMLKQLRTDKAELTFELEKKNQELIQALNGRRGMRGVSAPMLSPRLRDSPANGMSKGVNRVRESVGARSRGTSPAHNGDASSARGVPPSGGAGGSRFQPSNVFGGELPTGQARRSEPYRPR